MATITLTDRESDVLQVVRKHISKHGVAPTRREIGLALNLSAPSAERILQGLEQKGQLRLRTQWRGIFLTRRGERS